MCIIKNQYRRDKKNIVVVVLCFALISTYTFLILPNFIGRNAYYYQSPYDLHGKIYEIIYRDQGIRTGKKSIVVFIAVQKEEDLYTEYKLAHQTVQCYCSAKGYPLVVSDISRNLTLQNLCPQNDFMFQRHCALAVFLRDNLSVEWVLFVDADMAVVNPNHLLEEYLPKQSDEDENKIEMADLIFYERIFNGEITAGSYFARNTNTTVEFLHFWANYYYKLPRSWHGTDNGAIHAVFMDKFCGGNACSTRRQICLKLWQQSEDDEGLRMYSDCVKSILGNRNVFFSKADNLMVQFLTDFRVYWARDIWLTESKWSNHDFLLHGLKKSWQNTTKWGSWSSPFVDDSGAQVQMFNVEICRVENFKKWPYEQKYIANNADIDKMLFKRVQNMRMIRLEYLRRIEEYAEIGMVL